MHASLASAGSPTPLTAFPKHAFYAAVYMLHNLAHVELNAIDLVRTLVCCALRRHHITRDQAG